MIKLELETARLRIIALEKHDLELYLRDQDELGRRLDIAFAEDEYEPAVTRDLGKMAAVGLAAIESDAEKNDLWHTTWLIVLKETRACIGAFCFKGPASVVGHAEIGYSIVPRFRRRGFMCEAIERLIAWAFENPAIKAITAETPKTNIASQAVLLHCGFTQYMQSEKSVFWKRSRP